MAKRVFIEHVDLLNEGIVIIELSDGRTVRLTLDQILELKLEIQAPEDSDPN